MLSEKNRWINDNGDYTHNITYDLNENSIIMDLGGHNGLWGQQMIDKYNPNVYIIEPVTSFYEGMVSKFRGNPKVRLLNVGVGVEDKDGIIYMGGDMTSSKLSNGEQINVKFNSIETILNNFELEFVDLIQINIEGDEYDLLEHMIKTGSINKFDYQFVWESWAK
jgi:FkbM family methyltransferase